MSAVSSGILRHSLHVNTSQRQMGASRTVGMQHTVPLRSVHLGSDFEVNEVMQAQQNTIRDRAPHVIAVSLQEDIGLHNGDSEVVDTSPLKPIQTANQQYHNTGKSYPENGKFDDVAHIVSRKMANMQDEKNRLEIVKTECSALPLAEATVEYEFKSEVAALKHEVYAEWNQASSAYNMAPQSTYVTEPPVKFVNLPSPSYFDGQFKVSTKDPKFQIYDSYLQEIPYPQRLSRGYDSNVNESSARVMYRGMPKELAHRLHVMDSLYEMRVLNMVGLESTALSEQFFKLRHALNDADVHSMFTQAYSEDYMERTGSQRDIDIQRQAKKYDGETITVSTKVPAFPVFGATIKDVQQLTEMSYGRVYSLVGDSFGKELLINVTALDSQLGTNWLFHVADALRASTPNEEAMGFGHVGPASQAAMLPGTSSFLLPQGLETALRHHAWWHKSNVSRPEMRTDGNLGYSFEPAVNVQIMCELLQQLQKVPVSSTPIDSALPHRVPPSPSFFSHSSIYSSFEESVAALDIHNPQSVFSYQHAGRARATSPGVCADGLSAWPGIAPLCAPTALSHDWVVSRAWVILWSMFLGPVAQHKGVVVREAIKTVCSRGDYHSAVKMINLFRHMRCITEEAEQFDDYQLYQPVFDCAAKFTRDPALVEQLLKHAEHAYPVCTEYKLKQRNMFQELFPVESVTTEVPLDATEIANKKEVAAAMFEQFGELMTVPEVQQLHLVRPEHLPHMLSNLKRIVNEQYSNHIVQRVDGTSLWRKQLKFVDALDEEHRKASKTRGPSAVMKRHNSLMAVIGEHGNDVSFDGLVYANTNAPSQHLYVSALKCLTRMMHHQNERVDHGLYKSHLEAILNDVGLSAKLSTRFLRQDREHRNHPIVHHTVSEYEAEQARVQILNTFRSIPSEVLAETSFRDLKDTKLTAYTKEELNKGALREARSIHQTATSLSQTQATTVSELYHDMLLDELKLQRREIPVVAAGTHGLPYRKAHNRQAVIFPAFGVEVPRLSALPSAVRSFTKVLDAALRNFRVYSSPSASMGVLNAALHPRVVASSSLFNAVLHHGQFCSVLTGNTAIKTQAGLKYPLDTEYSRSTLSNIPTCQQYKLPPQTLQAFVLRLYTAVCTAVLLPNVRPYRSFAQANILPDFSRSSAHTDLYSFFRGVLVTSELDKHTDVPLLANEQVILHSGSDKLRCKLKAAKHNLFTQNRQLLSSLTLLMACKHSKLYNDNNTLKTEFTSAYKSLSSSKFVCNPSLVRVLCQTLLRLGDLKVGVELFKLLRKHEVPLTKSLTKTLIRSVAKSQKEDNLWLAVHAWMDQHGSVRGYHSRPDDTVYPKTDVPDLLSATYSQDNSEITRDNINSTIPQRLARYMASQHAYARPRDLTLASSYASAAKNQAHLRRMKHQLAALRGDTPATAEDVLKIEQELPLTVENNSVISGSGVDASLSLPVKSTLAPLFTFDTVHALYEITSGSVRSDEVRARNLVLAGAFPLTPSVMTADIWIALIDAAIQCDCLLPENFDGHELQFQYVAKPETIPPELPAILKIQYALVAAEYQHSLRLKKLHNQFKFENPLSSENPSLSNDGFVTMPTGNEDTLVNNNQSKGYIPVPPAHSLSQLLAIPASVYTHMFKRLMQHRLDVQLVTFSAFLHDAVHFNAGLVSMLNPVPQKSGYKVSDEIRSTSSINRSLSGKTVNMMNKRKFSSTSITNSRSRVSTLYGLQVRTYTSKTHTLGEAPPAKPVIPVLPSSTEDFMANNAVVTEVPPRDLDLDSTEDMMAFLFSEEASTTRRTTTTEAFKLDPETYSLVVPARSSRIAMLRSVDREAWESPTPATAVTESPDSVYANIAKRFTYKQVTAKLDALHQSHAGYMSQYQTYLHERELEEGFTSEPSDAHTEYLSRYNMFIGFFAQLCAFFPLLRSHPALQYSRLDRSRSVFFSDGPAQFPAQTRGKVRLPVYMPAVSTEPVTPVSPRDDREPRTASIVSETAMDKFRLLKKKYDRTFSRLSTRAEERDYTLPLQRGGLADKFFVVPRDEISLLGSVYGNIPIASFSQTLVSTYHRPLFRSGQCPITSADDANQATLRKHWRSSEQELARAFLRNRANTQFGPELTSLMQHARQQLPATHLLPAVAGLTFLPQLSALLRLVATFAASNGNVRDPALLLRTVESVTRLFDLENSDGFTSKRLFFERFKVLSRLFGSSDITTQLALHRIFLKYNVPEHIYLGLKRGFQLEDMHHFENVENPREFFRELLPISVVAAQHAKQRFNSIEVAMDSFETSVAKKGLIY